MNETFTEVVTESQLSERVAQLGADITSAYEGREPVLVSVLKGSIVFLADLVRHLPANIEIDFLALTRFGEEGRVSMAMDTSISLEGRDVLIVEDIVDTGLTLTTLRRMLEAKEVASLATVALIDKSHRRIVDVPLEFRGFEVGDEFLLGYGLDWNGRYRNVRSLWAVLDLAVLSDDPDAFSSFIFDATSRV